MTRTEPLKKYILVFVELLRSYTCLFLLPTIRLQSHLILLFPPVYFFELRWDIPLPQQNDLIQYLQTQWNLIEYQLQRIGHCMKFRHHRSNFDTQNLTPLKIKQAHNNDCHLDRSSNACSQRDLNKVMLEKMKG